MPEIRKATVRDLPDVMNVLDGAVLEADAAAVRDCIADDAVLVAVVGDDPERVLGALVLDADHIDAVAVRRRRRDRGIGTALVEAAAERRDRLTAEFDADLEPFYEKLGFEVEPGEKAGRLRGERSP
jgi:GNAT superfamily N-acetyltransferase